MSHPTAPPSPTQPGTPSSKATAPGKRPVNRTLLRNVTFLAIVVGVTLWFFDIIQPFLMPVFWAVVLAIVFSPVNEWLERKMPDRPALTATLTTLLITLTVLVPLVLITLAVIDQAQGIIKRVSSGELDPNTVIDYVEGQLPRVREFAEGYGVDFAQVRTNVQGAVATGGQKVLNFGLSIGQNFVAIAVDFFLMLYLLWFFLKDGEEIVQKAVDSIPLGDRDEWELVRRFATVSRATLKGTMIVATVQGTLGGLLFWALGIDGALFWGVIMTLLSLLPVGGSGIVWVPAAIILAVQGEWTDAIIIVAFGVLAIGLVDNLLRPLLVGRDTKMPDYLVLIATLGGIASFGLAGFVLGPVIAALFLTIWEMMRKRYGRKSKVVVAGAEVPPIG